MAQGRPGRRSGVGRPDEERKGLRAVLLGDPDRRRALLLSVLIHAGLLLAVAVWTVSPLREPEEPERVIVLELTPPQGGAGQTDAAAAELPAPERAESAAAGNATNEAAGVPESSAAETQAATQAQAEGESAQPLESPPAMAESPLPPSESPPQARVPATTTPPQTLPEQTPTTTLPEVEAPEVAPQPAQESIALPTPAAQAEVTPSVRVAVRPEAEVAQSQPLPTPEASVSLTTEPIVIPQAEAQVSSNTPIPRPEASASVVTRDIPQPQAGASVAQAAPIPQPTVSSEATPPSPLPQPQAEASVTPGLSLTITPRADVGASSLLVTPDANAVVTLPEPVAEAPTGNSVGPGGGADVAGSQTAEAADAGDGATNGQNAAAPQDAAGEGAAADDSGVASSGVANVQGYEVTQDQPLDVLIDNADAAYPQQGLVEASSVFEMPVEGGLTRLMAVYTEGEPVQVGPIRSARDYFLEAALQMNGTLVHVGGAPSTVSRIASQQLATVDALQDASLFAQAPDRLAPHSTFSTGEALREAIGRLPTPVSGTLYAPSSDAPNVNTLTVDYSADYSSGFRYLGDLDQYRWVRSGADATDTAGTGITADAVVVAQITALPYPDDPEGRLYLPYSGGLATLYLRGKAVAGSWTPESGFSFTTESGQPVDLRPFKAWLLFAPETAQVTQQ